MPIVHYYGKKTNFIGKTLFEILGNLRNFGINRMLIKQEELLQNPGKKCYYIVKKVEPVMDEKLQEGAVYAERVFRSAKVKDLVFVDEESWHTDWQLIPKEEEELYKLRPEEMVEHGHPSTIQILPRWMEVPPLMDVFLKRHFKQRGGTSVLPTKLGKSGMLNIRMHYDLERMNRPHSLHRVAEEDEESDIKLNLPAGELVKDKV